jgi:hypothetical protein
MTSSRLYSKNPRPPQRALKGTQQQPWTLLWQTRCCRECSSGKAARVGLAPWRRGEGRGGCVQTAQPPPPCFA